MVQTTNTLKYDAQTHRRQSFVLDCIRHMPGSARVWAVLATLLERFTFLLFIAISSSVSIVFVRQAAKMLGRK